ncbi:MAG: energy transducer TonB [Pyrinomonadaceae bacterium]
MKPQIIAAFCALLMSMFSAITHAQDPSLQVAAELISVTNLNMPWDAGLPGELIVAVEVDQYGSVLKVTSVKGPGPVCQQVERPDVTALRKAATEAALAAKFSPATSNGLPVPSSVFIRFPGPIVAETKSTADYVGPVSTKANNGKNDRFTVKGDTNYSAVLPPDYKGPVNTTASAKLVENNKTDSGERKMLSGGVLNGKAMSLPKPPYPPAAKAVRASGAVSVQVLIDENGDVFSAEPVSGHPLLRSATIAAACGAKFAPTRLESIPVKVSGIITYNFVSP